MQVSLQQYKIFKEKPRKHSFFFQVTDPWNSHPSEVVDAPMVEVFERSLDRHWRGHPQLYHFGAKKK